MRRLTPGGVLPLVALALIVVQACAVGAVPASTAPSAGTTGSPGVPQPTPPATAQPTAAAATDPAPPTEPPLLGGFHNVVCPAGVDVGTPSEPCTAYLLEEDIALWSVQLRGTCADWTSAPDGTLYVGCGTEAGTRIHALDRSGAARPGWPVNVAASIGQSMGSDFTYGCGRFGSALVGRPDGSLFVSLFDGTAATLHAFDTDGTPRPGWPVPMPGDPDAQCSGFAAAPDGSVRLWGYELELPDDGGLGYIPFARRTVFAARDAAGQLLPGWPIGSASTASGGVVGDDGTLYYVSATGKVWGHGPDGKVRAGWPHQLAQPEPPTLTPDGRLVFVLAREVVGLLASGEAAPGWPYAIPVERETLCVRLEPDCFGLVPAAFGPDGAVILALAPAGDGRGSRIVAIGRTGELLPGWPYELGDGRRASRLQIVSGRFLNVYACPIDGCGPDDEPLLLGFDGVPVYGP